MPKVPIVTRGNSLPNTLGTPVPTAQDLGAGVGNTLTEAGLFFAEKIKVAEDTRQLNNLNTTLHRDVSEFTDSLLSKPDEFETWEQQTTDFIQQRGEALQSQARNSTVGDAFTRELNRVGLVATTTVRGAARKRLVDVGRADLGQSMIDMQSVYVRQKNPVARQETIASVELALEKAQDAGYIGDEDLVRLKEKFKQDAFSTRVRNELQLDPSGTLEKLNNNEYGLNAEKNAIWKERAERAAEIERNDAIRQAEAAEKNQEDAIKDEQNNLEAQYLSYILEANESLGEVPTSMVLSIAEDVRTGRLRASQGRSLENDIKTADIPTDPAVFNEFDEDIENSQAVIDNTDIRTSPGLSVADRNKLISKNNTLQDKRLKQDFAQGKSVLLAMIRTEIGAINPFAKENEADLYALAKDELYDRLEGKESLQEILDDMKPRYSQAAPSLSSLPKPRFGTKPTSYQDAQKRLADIKLQQIDSGLNPSNWKALNREVELLEAYQEAYRSLEGN